MVVPYHKTGNTERGSVVAGSAFLTLSFAVSQKYPKRHVVTGAQKQGLNRGCIVGMINI